MSAGTVVWFTGLPQSGKSTLAKRVQSRLRRAARPVVLLDGDAVRASLARPPGFSARARHDFYLTLARLAALLARQGLTVLVPATANRARHRALARALAPRFVEVYVATPLGDCERRDTKGLYRAARSGRASALPGVGVRFDVPRRPEVVARGGRDRVALAKLLARLSVRG